MLRTAGGKKRLILQISGALAHNTVLCQQANYMTQGRVCKCLTKVRLPVPDHWRRISMHRVDDSIQVIIVKHLKESLQCQIKKFEVLSCS